MPFSEEPERLEGLFHQRQTFRFPALEQGQQPAPLVQKRDRHRIGRVSDRRLNPLERFGCPGHIPLLEEDVHANAQRDLRAHGVGHSSPDAEAAVGQGER